MQLLNRNRIRKFLLSIALSSLCFSAQANSDVIASLNLLDIQLIEFTKIINESELIPTKKPHAFITSWAPEVKSSARLARIVQKQPLAIWVRISFDQEVTDDFVNNFFQVFNKSKPTRHGKFKKEFVLTVPFSMTREAFQTLLDQTNKHFDPDFKTPQEIALQKEQEKIELENAIKIADEIEKKRKAEEERLKKEADEQKKLSQKREKSTTPITTPILPTSEKPLQTIPFVNKPSAPIAPEKIWSPSNPQERAEFRYLMQECNKITEYVTAILMNSSTRASSTLPGAIVRYLTDIGTPVAYHVLEAQVRAGRVPKRYLKGWQY